jgi:hypothetical protein
MRRAGVVQTIQDVVGFAKIVSASLGASYSLYLQHEAHVDDASDVKDEAWGHAPLLYRPLRTTESMFIQLGDERVSIATKERNWQIDVADGEVVLRSLGASAAYVRLRPDGSAEVNATSINLGGAATQFVALANLVSGNLTALKDAIKGAAIGSADGGATFKSAILTALSTWPSSVAASKVKAE